MNCQELIYFNIISLKKQFPFLLLKLIYYKIKFRNPELKKGTIKQSKLTSFYDTNMNYQITIKHCLKQPKRSKNDIKIQIP